MTRCFRAVSSARDVAITYSPSQPAAQAFSNDLSTRPPPGDPLAFAAGFGKADCNCLLAARHGVPPCGAPRQMLPKIRCLDPPDQNEDKDNDENKSDAARRVISPNRYCRANLVRRR